jgi:MarR family transcriptional regulator, organic hydroperoxide resistance regulator
MKRKEQKSPYHSRSQEAVVSVLRTTAYLRQLGCRLFDERGITPQQYNVMRILRGAGPAGLPTLDIVERMIEPTPGITRLLDRLESKKLVRRERPSADRRQVLCCVTKAGLDLLSELDIPLKNQASELLRRLSDSQLDELICLLERVRGEE